MHNGVKNLRKLLWFSCGFSAAALLFVCGAAAVLTALLLIGASALLFLRGAAQLRRRALAVFLGAALAFGWCAGYRALLVPAPDEIPKEATAFSAVITEPMRRIGTRRSAEAKVLWDGGSAPCLLYFPGDTRELFPGDRVRGIASLRAAEGWSEYLLARGTFLTGNVREITEVVPQTALSVWQLPVCAARLLRQSIRDCFPEDGIPFFLALVTGDRSELPFEAQNRLSVCGLYHTISLSGMHVSVLSGFIAMLCGRQRKLAAILGLPAVWLFTLLSGAASGTVRAAVMQTVLLTAPLLKREYDSPTALAAALLLIVLQNPWAIAGVGTQMSFLATAGIFLFCVPLTQRLTPEKWKEGRRFAPLRYVISTTVFSLSATAVTQPLSVMCFGMGSLAALPVNILCIWAITLAFAGGILTALLGLVFPTAAVVAATGLDLLRLWTDAVTGFFAALPVPALYSETPFLLAWLCFAEMLLPMLLLLRPKRTTAFACAALTFALCFGFTLAEKSRGYFTMLDVGQGQSLLWHDDDRTAVIDCGGSGEESGEIAARALLSDGVRQVDALILTHFDRDHTEGIAQLMERLRIGKLYIPYEAEDEAVVKLAAERGIPVSVVKEHCELFDGAITLMPPTSEKTDNSGGLSVLASAAGCDILVTGDLPVREENALLKREKLPDLEVLVAGHHGSADATGARLLGALRPELVWISVGENSYGHPAPEMLSRVRAVGGKAAATIDNKTMTIRW